jgi:cytochrome c-type biogenesis protein CcmH/NrfG
MPNEWIERLTELQKLLAVCPTDILARCDLALLLEQLDQHEDALFNWRAVLDFDPNNLKAREGVTRCRNRTGRPLQSRGERKMHL